MNTKQAFQRAQSNERFFNRQLRTAESLGGRALRAARYVSKMRFLRSIHEEIAATKQARQQALA
jgi:hypothetical protein